MTNNDAPVAALLSSASPSATTTTTTMTTTTVARASAAVAATSLGTGSLHQAAAAATVVGVMESSSSSSNVNNNNVNNIIVNNNAILASKIVVNLDTPPPTLDRSSIAALLGGGDGGGGDDDDDEPKNMKKKQYRLVAFDLDGTLLHSNHQLSTRTKAHLRYLCLDCGFIIVLATGRAISTVYDILLDLNLPSGIAIPVVSSNGACAFECRVVQQQQQQDDREDDAAAEVLVVQAKPLFATPVPEAVARKTIQLARRYGHCSQYYVGDEILADPIIATTPQKEQQAYQEQQDTSATTATTTIISSHLQLTQLYKDLTGANTIYLPRNDDFENICIAKGLPSKQLVLFPPLLQDEMMAVFEREFVMKCSNDNATAATNAAPRLQSAAAAAAATVVRGNLGWFLEILNPTVCKGHGLQRLVREHLSLSSSSLDGSPIVTMDDVIAFGDGDNDVEFLQMAGLGIVMANGRKVAKHAADCMTVHSNDANGVVETLQLLEEFGALQFPKTPPPQLPSRTKRLPSCTKTASTLSATSLSSSSASSSSGVAVPLQLDDTDVILEGNSSCNRQERCDTVEF
jgi:hydroxymethylpyrimidine pyrophosphatase-like HAD family hydrolase